MTLIATIHKCGQFLSWWFWRRWRIYCPTYSVAHLFDRRGSLFDYDEAYVSPCTMNEIWCGGFTGKWVPKIRMMGMEIQE